MPPACRAALPRADRFRVKGGQRVGLPRHRRPLLPAAARPPPARGRAGGRAPVGDHPHVRRSEGHRGARVLAWLQAVVDDRWALVDGDWSELDPAALAAALDEIRPSSGPGSTCPPGTPATRPPPTRATPGTCAPTCFPSAASSATCSPRTGDLVHVTTVADLGFAVHRALESARSLVTSREARARFAGQVESASLGRRKVGTRFRRARWCSRCSAATPVPPETALPAGPAGTRLGRPGPRGARGGRRNLRTPPVIGVPPRRPQRTSRVISRGHIAVD